MVTPYKTAPLIPPKAPNLPIAPVDYAQLYQDQLLNALRLYFNQIDNFGFGLLNSPIGGAFIKFPYGSFFQDGHTTLSANMTNVSTTPIQVASTAGFENSGFLIIEEEIIQYTTKTATQFDGTITRGAKSTTNKAHTAGVAVSEAAGVAAGASAAIKLDSVVLSNGVTVTVPDSKIYLDYSGVYNIQYSAQFLNYATTEDNVIIWFKKNNNDILTSSSIQQVPKIQGGTPGASILAINFVDQFNAGDYVELYWSSTTGNTVLATYPPTVVHPASPSIIVTVTFVSALP